jgi:hypothetical protein
MKPSFEITNNLAHKTSMANQIRKLWYEYHFCGVNNGLCFNPHPAHHTSRRSLMDNTCGFDEIR